MKQVSVSKCFPIKGQRINISGFALWDLNLNCSALQLRLYVNHGLWLCSNKTLFVETGCRGSAAPPFFQISAGRGCGWHPFLSPIHL